MRPYPHLGGSPLGGVLRADAVGRSAAAPLVPAPRPRPSSRAAARLGALCPKATESEACAHAGDWAVLCEAPVYLSI
jgi:hypothetical protein